MDRGVQSEEEYRRQGTESWLEEGIGIEEVIAAIAKLKNGKALGICGVSAEMLKLEEVQWLNGCTESST